MDIRASRCAIWKLHAPPSREADINPSPKKGGYPAPHRVTFLTGPNRDFPKWRRQLLCRKRAVAVAALSWVSRRRYSAIVVSDDNSTEVCTKPSAWDSRPVPIYSLTVAHVKCFRFQSIDVIRTSENSRNFRVSGKR